MGESKKDGNQPNRRKVFPSLCILAVILSIALNNITFLTFVEYLDDFLTLIQNPKESWEKNAYLNGNFKPVHEEHVNIPLKVVEGSIPEGLEGLFVRTGPNPLPNWTKLYHWFDGHGMLHNIRIKSGKATYTNQYIKTPRFKLEQRLGKDYFLRFGELVGVTGLFKAILSSYKVKAHGMDSLTNGAANTDTVMFNDRFYLLNEANLPFEARLNDDGTFTELGFVDFNGVLDYPVSAHPKVDYQTNTMLFHSYSPDPELMKRHGSFKVGEILSNGTVINYVGIHDDHVSFAHDMMITKNWMVLYDSSVHFDVSKIFEGKNVFTWKQDKNLKIILVSRATGEIKPFDMGSAHALVHPMNAWEESDGTVVMWAPIGDRMELELDSGSNFYHMSEMKINPNTGEVSMVRIDEQHNQEFCNVRRDFYGRFARYGVAGILDAAAQDGMFRGFIVWDMKEKKAAKIVHFADNEFGGEPVLLSKTGTTDSRDFYVGTFVYNFITGSSSFVLYEEEKLVVRLSMPYRVPFGFHGKWYPEAVLQSHIRHNNSD
jgi:carotenoid 9,10(9',10')-cleavage dioxygenase 1